MPACARPGTGVPGQTHDYDAAVLVRQHLPGFLARLENSGQGPLPEFVKAELEGLDGCGDFEKGFMQTACRKCGDDLLVPLHAKAAGAVRRAWALAMKAGDGGSDGKFRGGYWG